MKLGYNKIFTVAASALMLASCDFLDVAPAQRATMNDAMKNKASTESWLYGNFDQVKSKSPITHSAYEGSTDEFTEPRIWDYNNHRVAFGTLNATNVGDTYFRHIYGQISNCHLFLRELERQNPDFLTEQDKALYRAQMKFVKAYYYFRILNLFGPCPIIDEFVEPSTTKDQFPGRSHYDYCVNYICNLLDEAYPDLPGEYALDNTYGAGSKTACKALKSRVLLYAASPLWNGQAPWANWTNEGKYETPGYGDQLVSKTFDLNKWISAKQAAEEAIATAKQFGRELMQIETALTMASQMQIPVQPKDGGNYLPVLFSDDPATEDVNEAEVEMEKFANHVMLMRLVMASDETMGNKELIWTYHSSGDIGLAEAKPRNVIENSSGQWVGGWSGLSPTLNIVEQFYTKDGKRPVEDPNFAEESEWLKSAGLGGDRSDIIKLNANREPRFYAWIHFDGCDVGPLINNGKPIRLDLKSSDRGKDGACNSGYNYSQANRDLNQSGYLSDKFFSPAVRWTSSSYSTNQRTYPVALFRMAELYLNMAECCAEIYMNNGDEAELEAALVNLNEIRRRAGVPELTKDDCKDKSIREWVRNERTIELFMEGHRYYDLRRWLKCEEHLAQGVREGLDAFVSKRVNPTFEQFNQRVKVDGDFVWNNRMYLLPIQSQELYSNPQMVQAPGY